MSHNDKILQMLIRGDVVTPAVARMQARCDRLSARSYDLRHMGFVHERKTLPLLNGKRVGHYWMTYKQRRDARTLLRKLGGMVPG